MNRFFEESTIEILTRPFDQDQIRTRKGLGTDKFYYLTIENVISRLNEAFGYGWSFEVREHKEVEEQILVLGRLSVRDKGNSIIFRDAFGSAPVQRFGEKSSNSGKRLDAGNDFKSAQSDAIKKAAASFGIGVEDIRAMIETHGSGIRTIEGNVSSVKSSSFPKTQPVVQPSQFIFQPIPQTQPKTSTFPNGSIKKPVQAALPINTTPQTKPVSTFPDSTINKTQIVQPNVANTTPAPVKTAPNPFEANIPKNNFTSNLMSNSPSAIKFSQRDAIITICRTKGVTEADLILNAAIAFDNKALANKAVVDSLTSEEATLVIRYANTLPDIRRGM